MTVTDPSGSTWRVTRRWVPWQRRLRGAADGSVPPSTWDDLGQLGDDPVSMVLGLLTLLLVLPALLVLVLAGVELVLLALLLPFALLGRIILGRHWHVEARRGWLPVWETDAGAWRDSSQKIHEVVAAIGRGDLPPHTIGR